MAIYFDKETRTFYLDGKNISYVFCINEWDYAEHLYFGEKIPHEDLRYTKSNGSNTFRVVPEGEETKKGSFNSYFHFGTELSFFGTGDFREPTVQVENPAGDRLSSLLYDGYEILSEKPRITGMPSLSGGETLVLHLRDRHTDFAADLYYTVYDDADVVARRAVYRNGGAASVTLRRAYSFAMSLPGQDYEVLSLHGAWARERQIQRTPLPYGVFSLDSKRCSSSATMNPFLGLLSRGATEESGDAYGVSLVYSSSFVLKTEGVATGETLVTGGVNDFDFSFRLGVGEAFETPEAVLAYSAEGLGGMSRAYHDAFREYLIPKRHAKSPRPLLINNWEATYFHFSNERLMGIIDVIAGTGVDTFVLDDGWFGKRDNDHSGLGDWVVNEKKLAGGLKTIIDYVHAKGMKFGLWFEPEMISEDSDLYRAHPDFAIAVPGRRPCRSRNQLMLDLTREEVRTAVADMINRVLRENQIEYVKWDYNRNVTDLYTESLPPDRQTEFAHRYVLGVYDLCERIVRGNPDIFFEGCSGGGGRFDPAMLSYFPQIWTSDDTDAEERTFIQYGTSVVYPLSTMSCHVSICPNHQTGRTTPFATRGGIAHLGATGYELDTTQMSEEDRAAVLAQTAEYRRCQELILAGDLYRIENPQDGNYFSVSVVSKDKTSAILQTYRRLHRPNDVPRRVKMRGLDPARRYFVEELNAVYSGATLMHVGIAQKFPSTDFATLKYHFFAVEE